MFPQLFDGFLQSPVVQRAVRKENLALEIIDIKEFAPGSFRHIDDSPFGGGAGMVMRCQPVLDALRHVKGGAAGGQVTADGGGAAGKPGTTDGNGAAGNPGTAADGGTAVGPVPGACACVTAALSPAGAVFCQKTARRYKDLDHLILICGHYEGMDERILRHVDEEISIGDYILTGGEIAAMAVSDAVIRLLPGALRKESTTEESFEDGLLEYPQYTQPAVYEGEPVPAVLLSGDHEKIRKWRLKESLRRTLKRRPDLLEDRKLTPEEEALLREVFAEEEACGGGAPA